MKPQTTIDMIAALVDQDTEQASFEDLKEAYWNESWRYFGDLPLEEIEMRYAAMGGEV